MSIRIIVDSASDISQAEAKELGITVIPMRTTFGEEEFLDGINMTPGQFFEKLVETDELPKTSLIGPAEYGDLFKKWTDKGEEVLCITISSKLSGCYQSAVLAAEDYEGKVIVLDSTNVTVGEQILTRYAIKLRDHGLSLQEIADELNEKKKKIRLVALLDTLEYLKKGGRISAAVALAGSLLSIKPVVAIEHGEVTMLGKARGSKNGNNILNEQVQKAGGIDFDMPFSLAYSGMSTAMLDKYLADHKHLYEDYVTDIPACQIGSTIGTHVGPGAIAVSFFAQN
ncbi:MAG: DegV family protein [Lachnospiraceae bacterium]